MRKYGIDAAAYDEMLRGQNGVCAICLTATPGGRFFCVDHCHRTGRVRGLLCTHCNHGLGKFADSTANLERAINYLKCSEPGGNT